ncbi:heparinase II/III family protein [Pelagicoccus sp. SDUM812002]|uniref:heparinase II/III domain-containing protein n=1 Tax=Pelagicoccus sp. SDUM812002 TaxID=3041266 RepID=UPI00280D63B1|nr:heparinase II/III family protein [Pelagicoccus sp. SDUM812002]MDQ8187704.1 heparinase II/III family protein [Pelagicoccus sp. SDUM812002]
MTRRDLLRYAGSSLMLASLPLSLKGKSTTPRSSSGGRLFFERDEIEKIRANARTKLLAPTFNDWTERTPQDLETALNAFEKSGDIIRDFASIINLLTELSIVQLVKPQPARRDALVSAITRLIGYETWDYFLDGSKPIGIQRASIATVRILFAREVLDGDIDAKLDKAILDAIAEKGCLPCYRAVYGMDHPDTVEGWSFDKRHEGFYDLSMERWPMILGDNNLRSAPSSALGIGAIALLGHDPRAEKWLATAESSFDRVLRLFSPDGSYFEGLSYAGYTLRTALNFFDAHARNGGTIDWAKKANFDGMLDFIATMQAGTQEDGTPDIVNFSDARSSVHVCIPAWIGKHTGNPLAQYEAENLSVANSFLDFIWYEPGKASSPPPESLQNVRNNLDWVLCRSGWGSQDAVLAFRSGGPCNHEHADRNHITYKIFGERLLTDLFGAAYDRRHSGWEMRKTKAHNSVLVNGLGHHYHDGSEGTNDSQAYAVITQFEDHGDTVWWTSDATAAYLIDNDHISKVLRTVIFAKPDIIVVVDQVRLHFGEQPMSLRFFPDNRDGVAKLSASKNSFLIERPQASLHGTVHSRTEPNIATTKLDVTPETGDFPCVELSSPPAFTHEIVTVLQAAPKNKKPRKLSVSSTANGWLASEGDLKIDINTRNITPVVTLG